ncbi:hypothetical protein [Bradyrhizobium sp.]|uniref:hypothetical protein n=1 Tax=Bradyrhizobium sp. TaxID=376 RepID=UPI003C34BB97
MIKHQGLQVGAQVIRSELWSRPPPRFSPLAEATRLDPIEPVGGVRKVATPPHGGRRLDQPGRKQKAGARVAPQLLETALVLLLNQ